MDIFLDPQKSLPYRGVRSVKGEPLKRIRIPEVNTLIYSSGETFIPSNVAFVDISKDIQKINIPTHTITDEERDFGIIIDNVYSFNTTSAPGTGPSTVPGMGTGPIPGGRVIPQTYKEVLDNIDLVSAKRSGIRNSNIYQTAELKAICRNLNLGANGKKEELVARITDAVNRYFNINNRK